MRSNQKRAAGWLLAIVFAASLVAAGCASWNQESDWRWKQFNSEWKPLPGDPAY
jgi:hypothetical protein